MSEAAMNLSALSSLATVFSYIQYTGYKFFLTVMVSDQNILLDEIKFP